MRQLLWCRQCVCLRWPAESGSAHMKDSSISKPATHKCELHSLPLPELPPRFQPGQFLIFLFSQLLSSVSVIVPPADSSYGNGDISADIAIHKNSNGWGPVARRAPLGKVIGQAAKGPESAEHVVLHPGDFTSSPYSPFHMQAFSLSLFFNFSFLPPLPHTVFTLKL